VPPLRLWLAPVTAVKLEHQGLPDRSRHQLRWLPAGECEEFFHGLLPHLCAGCTANR
jgi:hypothetical protein